MLIPFKRNNFENSGFSDFQKTIIKSICEIQLDALISLYEKGVDSWPEFQELYSILEIDKNEVIDKLSENYYNFQAVSEDPDNLFKLDPLHLSIFGTILFHTNDVWVKKNEEETRSLWAKLFIAQDMESKFKGVIN
jgi:hypothetical protein